MNRAIKSTLKSGSIALALAVMLLTTLSCGQANYEGPPHNVIYTNGYDANGNDAFPELANTDHTDVVVNSEIQVDWHQLPYDKKTIVKLDLNSGTSTPKPGALAMLGSGVLGLAGVLRYRRTTDDSPHEEPEPVSPGSLFPFARLRSGSIYQDPN